MSFFGVLCRKLVFCLISSMWLVGFMMMNVVLLNIENVWLVCV